jgi:hypothetical protein
VSPDRPVELPWPEMPTCSYNIHYVMFLGELGRRPPLLSAATLWYDLCVPATERAVHGGHNVDQPPSRAPDHSGTRRPCDALETTHRLTPAPQSSLQPHPGVATAGHEQLLRGHPNSESPREAAGRAPNPGDAATRRTFLLRLSSWTTARPMAPPRPSVATGARCRSRCSPIPVAAHPQPATPGSRGHERVHSVHR